METFPLFREYVARLVQAIEKSDCDIVNDSLPYIGSIEKVEQQDQFSVTTKGGSKLFDIFDVQSYLRAHFFNPPEIESENGIHHTIACRIIEYLEKKYMCVLDAPGFVTFSETSSNRRDFTFRCMSWIEAINAFRASTQGRTEDITEKMTKINEGITQKLDDIDKQKETLENAKAKISAFTTSSKQLIDTLRDLNEKLTHM